MFTGIVSGIGRIVTVTPLGEDDSHGKRLSIEAPAGYLDDVALGDSIALNGACMTVTSFDAAAGRFAIDISAESLDKTAGLVGLGGHLVSGHVDGLGRVAFFAPVGESWELRVQTSAEIGRFLAYKGSITVNGVSLTVNRVVDSAGGCEFSINLIPHTIEHTTLGDLSAGQQVNLEVDLIARYVARMLGKADGGN
jgi:riboflavin synthase